MHVVSSILRNVSNTGGSSSNKKLAFQFVYKCGSEAYLQNRSYAKTYL